MPKALEGLTKQELLKKKRLAIQLNRLEKIKESIPTIKIGSEEHRIAKERMLYLLIQEQEKIIKALIRKAKSGDVKAITEVLDRLFGKSKETIDFNGNVQFSLKALAQQREALLQNKIIDVMSDNTGTIDQVEDNGGA